MFTKNLFILLLFPFLLHCDFRQINSPDQNPPQKFDLSTKNNCEVQALACIVYTCNAQAACDPAKGTESCYKCIAEAKKGALCAHYITNCPETGCLTTK